MLNYEEIILYSGFGDVCMDAHLSDFTDETPVLPQQEEKLSVQVETLGNEEMNYGRIRTGCV